MFTHQVEAFGWTLPMPSPNCEKGVEVGSRVKHGNRASTSLHVHCLLNFSPFLSPRFHSLTSMTSAGLSKHRKASLPVQSIPGSSPLCPQSGAPSLFHFFHLHLSLSCHLSQTSINWNYFVSLPSRSCDAQKWGLILLIIFSFNNIPIIDTHWMSKYVGTPRNSSPF